VGVTVTGLANLAVKVADLDEACAFYEAAGGQIRARMLWNNGERADVHLGPVMITLFTRAIYEDSVEVPSDGRVGSGDRRRHIRQAPHRVR
jgi:hypothetical protein